MRHYLIGLVSIGLSCGCLVQQAQANPADVLLGRYAFDWYKTSAKTICKSIDAKLLKLLESSDYSCDLKGNNSTSSGKHAVTCTKKDKSGEFLIFATKSACEDERTTQISNGD